MAFHKFLKAVHENQHIPVFGDGTQTRDFTYIDDVIESISRLIKKGPPAGTIPYKIYNVGNHKPEELMQVVSLLEQELGRKAIKEMLPMQPGDVPATYADVADLMRDVGFRPDTPIADGIRNFVAWYRQHYD